MIEIYSAAMTFLVAGTFGTPGYLTWAFLWATALYRHTSKPRKRGVELTTGEEASEL